MISIRQLGPDDDLSAVLRLCREFFAEYERHHTEFFDIDEIRDDDISGRFTASIESKTGATFIALVDDTIVGYIGIDIREQPPFYKFKKVGAAWGLMVAKDYRRQGIATRLLAEARAWFRRKGIYYFTGYTAATNKEAIEFYKRNGLIPLHTNFIGETSGS